MIKSLNKQQLKGILPILWDEDEMADKKTFEFDLDQLPDVQLKRIENYVISCINENKNI